MYIIREKFKDWNDVEREEEFYFNLTTAELTKMELSEYGGLTNMLQLMIEKKDVKKMIEVFELIIDKSYGVKSPDGRFFYKEETKPGILAEFKATQAYSQIFTRFATDDKFASEFVKNVIPQDLSAKVNEMEKSGELDKIVKTGKVVDIPSSAVVEKKD